MRQARSKGKCESQREEGYTRPGAGEFDAVAEHYDYLMRTVPYQRWVEYVEALMARHNIKADRVLDLCCGTGRVGSELARRGYRVVGVDLSEQMVRHCALRDPPLPAAVMDACCLGLKDDCLDLVVSLYDSLNYILDPAGLQACFDGVARCLKPGGWFIFDMNTTLALASGLFAHSNRGSGEDLEYEWRPSYNPVTKICKVDMVFFWRGAGGPKKYTEVHYQRAYKIGELRRMLLRAGFGHLRFYHAYSFGKPNPWSDRIFAVASASR
ncbi:MAG: class I SAM-dependent methyltransferase [Armatimonadota bacterium]